MKNNIKKAKSAAMVTVPTSQQQQQQQTSTNHDWQIPPDDNSVNNEMESGTLPPATMLLHSNDSIHPMPPSDSPMNQFSDIFSSRQSVQLNNKTNKRKLDDFVDPSSTDFDSSSSIKPQKTEQNETERSLSRTGTPLSNGPLPPPPPSSTPSRNGNDNGPSSFDFGPTSNNNNNNNNNNNTGRNTPNSSLFARQTPPPPSLQQQQQQQQQQSLSQLPPPSSYMPMSPRNQYSVTSDTPYLQTNNQVFVFTTQLANEAAESVLKNEHPNIIEYHKSLPSTSQYLNSLSNNMNNSHNSLLGGPMHMNHGPPPPPGCHSPRTMQMMMGGPGPHNPHLQHHNNIGGPPPNWPHPHFHPHQQQPPFGRLTPGPGGLPPPSHLLPPGGMMMNGQPPSDGIENLTPERAKHRKNQLNKIEDLKTKITGGRNRGGRAKANAAAAAAASGNMPSSMNGGPLPPNSLDPHQQQMMMMNSPHGVGPPHHMMGIGPPQQPPPHMLPPGMRGPDGMMLDMNGLPPPPHGYMNGPMPPNFHGQYGPGPGDPYGQLPPPLQQAQATRDWNKMQMEHIEGKVQHMRGQPPPYSSQSPSSLTPPIATTSTGGAIGPNGKLLSPKMEPSTTPRLYKVGQPEKFMPDSLPSSANKKLPGNPGEVQLTSSPTQMDYNEIGMEGEELIISRHLNRAYRPTNGVSGGLPLPSSSSSLKDEPMTPLARSTSTPNNNLNPLSCGQQPAGSTTPTHISQGSSSHLTPQSVSAVSPRPAKLTGNSSLSSPLMLSNNNSSGKDEPLDMNGGPKTPTSNMAPPLSSMLQMTNSLQSANSPYNSSNNTGSKPPSLSSNLSGNGPLLTSPNLGHMGKSMDQFPPPSHMSLPPHQQQHMQFQNMNPHHRMMGIPESMPPHYNPHHGGNLPPPHPHMYKMMPPHHSFDPSGMMLSHPGGPPRSSKGLPPPQLSNDPMQQHLHHLPPPHYVKMHNMDPSLGPPPPGHPQQHMRFGPMMDDGFGMGPPPPSHHPHHPHMHPHMHPHSQMHHQQMHPNDGRPPPPPQAINNTYVSTTMSIQQLNIQSLGAGGPPSELQTGTIHYHAPSANGPDSQQQGPPGPNGNNSMFSSQQQPQQFATMNNMSINDPSFAPQFNDLQPPPSNLSVDGGQPPPYW
ncbi:unnamed protein product [Adineta steineri]|uniref:Uncharacterized protein n=1 Tax=Adineta steineri TaxID=433720 RepID=A0A815UVD9_9BILA|nr:unnamed protein product [Adineta steineri]CAF1651274.1 unnamed protein product [Adineta steineri]